MMMTPKYTKNSIDRAGNILISSEESAKQERDDALDIFNNWRTQFLYPLNTLQATLRSYVKKMDNSNCIVAQRLKRAPAILDKLRRYPTMRLSRMQDIGGLRAIVSHVSEVRTLALRYDQSKAQHILRRKDDYIAEPKSSGYRGIHLVYEYHNKRNSDYDGLLIEIQLRTRLQHLWATAVETIGTFFQESFKSSQGSQIWLDFFKLVSAVFARKENEQPHSDYCELTQLELIKLLENYINQNAIFASLRSIHAAKVFLSEGNAKYWVIESDAKTSISRGYRFYSGQKEEANIAYRAKEESPQCQSGESQVVLVSVDSLQGLKRAYPSFFSDVSDFTQELRELCGHS